MNNQKRFPLITVSMVLLLASCATPVIQDLPPVEDRSTTTETAPPVSSRLPQPESITAEAEVPPQSEIKPSNQAVLALLDSASQLRQQGDLTGAQSHLQRAQRISPRDPNVYYDLAKIHLELKDYGLAEQVALKGIAITESDPEQQRRFWLLIATIRSSAGDFKGATEARRQADNY